MKTRPLDVTVTLQSEEFRSVEIRRLRGPPPSTSSSVKKVELKLKIGVRRRLHYINRLTHSTSHNLTAGHLRMADHAASTTGSCSYLASMSTHAVTGHYIVEALPPPTQHVIPIVGAAGARGAGAVGGFKLGIAVSGARSG